MSAERRYEFAVIAALTILDEIDAKSGLYQHERVTLAVMSILHAMDCWAEERREMHAPFSVN
jgi:hypothetical protein